MSCQSAPPGSTRPASRSPRKLPPVMGMMRRRPSGVAPSSWAGARVTSTRSRGASFKRFQETEQLAVGARRAAFLLLAARVADQRAQLLQVGAGVLGDITGERRIVGQEVFPHGFQTPVPRRLLRRMAGERVELRADGGRIDVAHQAADILQLAPAAFVALDVLRLEHRLTQRVGDLQVGDLRLGQLDQRDAERLQIEHLLFAPRFTDELILHRGYHSAPMPKRHGFTFEHAALRDMAEQVLARAKQAGASGCESEVSEGYGLTVPVRKGKPDTIERNRDRSLGVSIYLGERPKVRRGNASTSDLSPAALEQTVDAALAIARHTAEDDAAGLPEPDLLAKDAPDLDLFHPWPLSTEEAIVIAKRCEDAAFAA